MSDAVMTRFREAVALAAENLVIEAAGAFREIVDRHPESELADDALYNEGACWLALNQFQRAADTFREVVRRYPDARISTTDGRGETGRTAAKAWLGLVSANLGLGRVEDARAAVAKLADYSDSKVAPAAGIERSFHDIGSSLLSAALEETPEADQVTASDVVDG